MLNNNLKSVKIFTYTDRINSPFLEMWVKYYTKIQNSSLSILCKNTIDPLIISKYNNVEFINVSNYYNSSNIKSFVAPTQLFADYQELFLKNYDRVIYADLDEFIVHPDINSIIQSDFYPCLVTQGIEIVQTIENEDSFDFTKSITSQRHNMIYSKWYDKPLILSDYINWTDGKHNHGNFSTYVNNLYLIHLGKFCISLMQQWAKENTKLYTNYPINWDEYLRTDPLIYQRVLNNPIDSDHPMIPIPSHIKTLIDTIL